MNTNFLFPNSFKKIGWVLFILGLILGLYYLFFQSKPGVLDYKLFALVDQGFLKSASFFTVVKTNLLDVITGLLIIFGGVFIAFSKEKYEDEFISKIRLESLVWATYINYVILIFSILFVFGLSFFYVLIFNMFTILIFFVIRFNWLLHKSKRGLHSEK